MRWDEIICPVCKSGNWEENEIDFDDYENLQLFCYCVDCGTPFTLKAHIEVDKIEIDDDC